MTTLLSRRTQRTVVERIRRDLGVLSVDSSAVATRGFFIMSAILDYSSAGTGEFTALSQGIRRMCSFPLDVQRNLIYVHNMVCCLSIGALQWPRQADARISTFNWIL